MYQGLTIEQARSLLPFPLVVPRELPSYLVFSAATVSSTSVPGAEPPNTATLYYEIPESESQQSLVQVWESLSATQPAKGEGATEESLTIRDTLVTKIVQPNATGRLITSYSWTVDDVSISILAIVDPPLAEADLEQMIACMLE